MFGAGIDIVLWLKLSVVASKSGSYGCLASFHVMKLSSIHVTGKQHTKKVVKYTQHLPMRTLKFIKPSNTRRIRICNLSLNPRKKTEWHRFRSKNSRNTVLQVEKLHCRAETDIFCSTLCFQTSPTTHHLLWCYIA